MDIYIYILYYIIYSAAGLAICELLLGIGLKNIIICDTVGAIYLGRPNNMNEFKVLFPYLFILRIN